MASWYAIYNFYRWTCKCSFLVIMPVVFAQLQGVTEKIAFFKFVLWSCLKRIKRYAIKYFETSDLTWRWTIILFLLVYELKIFSWTDFNTRLNTTYLQFYLCSTFVYIQTQTKCSNFIFWKCTTVQLFHSMEGRARVLSVINTNLLPSKFEITTLVHRSG